MTYLVDTPLLVELLRPEPSDTVTTWVRRHEPLGLATTALAMAELQAGVARTSALRRNRLTRWVLAVEGFFQLTTAILPFDIGAARVCARLLANGAAGEPPPLRQAMVAGIAEANGLVLAVRHSPHLALWGGSMVDPWATEMEQPACDHRSRLLDGITRA